MARFERSFPREARLRRRADFLAVQSQGRKVREAHLLVLFLPGEAAAPRVGLTVSRKVGGSVVRNRVKRWLREAVRHEQGLLVDPWDVVLVAHPNAASAGAAPLRADVRDAFERIGRTRRVQR